MHAIDSLNRIFRLARTSAYNGRQVLRLARKDPGRCLVALVTALVCSCSATKRDYLVANTIQSEPDAAWILVGSEEGLPVSAQAAATFDARWRSEAQFQCAGSFSGTPVLQITSLAPPGKPFADTSDTQATRVYSAALGLAYCTSLFAATSP